MNKRKPKTVSKGEKSLAKVRPSDFMSLRQLKESLEDSNDGSKSFCSELPNYYRLEVGPLADGNYHYLDSLSRYESEVAGVLRACSAALAAGIDGNLPVWVSGKKRRQKRALLIGLDPVILANTVFVG